MSKNLIRSLISYLSLKINAWGACEAGKVLGRKLTEGFYNIVAKRGRLVVFIIAIVTVIFLTGILSGFMLMSVKSNYQVSSTLSSVGVLKSIGIGIYEDSNLVNRVDSIDWGIMERGSQKSFTLYLRNEGNFPATLSILSSNWNPSTASSYVDLSWNYNGQTINAGGYIQTTLTLSISPNAIGINNFGFDITIIGSG